MKSKLLFTAALMSAMTGTAQVTWVDVRGVNGVEDSWAMPMDEGTELPEPLVFYDFQSGTEDSYELKSFGNGTKPNSQWPVQRNNVWTLGHPILKIWGMCKSQILLKVRHLTTAPQFLCGCIVPEPQAIPFGDLDWEQTVMRIKIRVEC